MAGNFLIAYPDDGTREKKLAWSPSGILHIDFLEGKITKPDGTTVTLKKKLEGSSQDYIRSFSFLCSQSCDIALGPNIGTRVQTDVGGWNVFENVQVQEISIFLDSAPTPDETEFQIIASTSRKAFYRPRVLKMHRNLGKAQTMTADAYVTFFLHEVIQYRDHTIHVTASTNDLKYIIYALSYNDGTADLFNIVQAETTIAAGSQDVIFLQGAYKKIWVTCKNAGAGSNSAITVSYTGGS